MKELNECLWYFIRTMEMATEGDNEQAQKAISKLSEISGRDIEYIIFHDELHRVEVEESKDGGYYITFVDFYDNGKTIYCGVNIETLESKWGEELVLLVNPAWGRYDSISGNVYDPSDNIVVFTCN